MPVKDPATRTARARRAALVRHRGADDPQALEAARDVRAASLAQHIARVAAEAPPLTDEQRDRLAVLLRGGGRIV